MTTPEAAAEPAGDPAPDDHAPPPGARVVARVRWLLVAASALVALAAIGYGAGWFARRDAGGSAPYYCPMHPSVIQDHPGECPICSMTLVPLPRARGSAASPQHPQPTAAEPSALEYHCPMHPEVVSRDPSATCDQCGMKLVPKPGQAAPGRSSPPTAAVPGLAPVQLSPERIQLTGMRTAPVRRERLSGLVRAAATIAANEQGRGVLEVRFAGWIERLLVEQTGQFVQRGQVVATIYGPDVLAAQQEYLNALRWSSADPARSALPALSGSFKEDARRRLELLGISNEEIEALERTGQPQRAIPLRSPLTGYVTQKNAVAGLYVQPGMALFEIANLSTVWAIAEIYEHDLARVRTGQRAILSLAAYPGETFTGKLTFIYPALELATRTLRVRIEFPNKRLRLKPGMYGTVELESGGVEGLTIPREALVDTGAQQYVFVAKPGGLFEPRLVTPGARSGERIQIEHGLAEDEVVVTAANFWIDSESRLRATIEAALQPPAAAE